MKRAIVLDSGPLGLLAHTKLNSESVDCTKWFRGLFAAENDVYVPEIADYEVRRELLRIGATKGLLRLDSLVTLPGTHYLPIETGAMRRAAQLWANVRRAGRPTADPKSLDADVILAAQVLELGSFSSSFVIATTNQRHLERFVHAAHWRDIG